MPVGIGHVRDANHQHEMHDVTCVAVTNRQYLLTLVAATTYALRNRWARKTLCLCELAMRWISCCVMQQWRAVCRQR
jgi:hypothetical protein